jgi:site-specific DNA-cytosine methylase
MSKIQVSNNGKEITNGTVRLLLDARLDILAGGTPCQDVSVAGKRAGMQEGSGTRSSLAFDFVRLARELGPRYIIWENVAGAIDSKNAPDFLAFLRALGDCGYSLAWRVLDAQYVRVDGMERAVPQRRRRVWVVGCLGADESRAAEILFEPDCVAGHTAPRRRTGEGFAYSLAGRDRVDAGVVGEPAVLNFQGSKSNNCVTNDGSCPNINAMHGHDVHVVALGGDKLKPREDQRKGGNGFGVNEEGAGYTLTGVDRHGVAYGIGNGQAAEASATIRECSQTLNCMHDKQATVQCYDMTHTDDPGRKVADGVSPTLQSRMGTGGNQVPLAVSTNSNGGDVAPTISSCEYKMGQKQKDTGGGYVVTRNLSASGATCSTPERTPPTPPTSASASSLPSPQEPRRAQSAQG